MEERKHWDLIQEKLNLDEGQLKKVHTIEVLPALEIKSEALALIPYDLGIYVEESDFQIVFSKYKLDKAARILLRSNVDELALANERPFDVITGKVRAWKDDLYQAIAEFGKDATKLLKKEVMRYSQQEVEKLVRDKTVQKEEELQETRQLLSEQTEVNKQLQTEISALKEQMNQMQAMMTQLMSQQTTTNGNGNSH